MDQLDSLLDSEPVAARELRQALERAAPAVETINVNCFEAVLDREARQAEIFDLLDATAASTVVSFEDLRGRLGQTIRDMPRSAPSCRVAGRKSMHGRPGCRV